MNAGFAAKKRKIARPEPNNRPDLAQEAAEKLQRTGTVDRPLLLLTLLLLAIGLICLFSASYATAYEHQNQNSAYYILRQGAFGAVGLIGMLILSNISYRKLHYFALPAVVFAALVMATIKIPGLKNLWETKNEATRWIAVRGIGTFQPSELAKVAVILCFASLTSIFGKKKMHTFRYGMLPFLAILGVFAVEMYWEKHLSGMAIIAVIGMMIIFVGGANLIYFLLGAGGIVGAGIWYIKTHKYALNRIEIWLNPWSEPRDAGYQGVQSQMAIGSGGFWGLGLGQGRQKHLYLPEPANDFIFSSSCEELGFVGASLIVILFALLIWRGFYIALNCPDKFGSLLAVGITGQIAAQTVLNLFVVTGLFPITGASLPFFSYGGTALLIQLAEMGILLNISRELPVMKEG